MLEGKVSKNFGGLKALDNVEFFVGEKSICGLIGPNGSGKTTLFNCITGVLKPNDGYVKFLGSDITKLKPHNIAKLGIARTYQIPQPFNTMSVLENVIVSILFRRRHLSVKDACREAVHYLDYVGLTDKKDINAGYLNVVERKKLEIARALASEPKILMLDEPLSGLSGSELQQACDMIKKVRDELAISIFWIEHVMRAIMPTVDRVIVLDKGKKIAEGTPREVAKDEIVKKAYLG